MELEHDYEEYIEGEIEKFGSVERADETVVKAKIKDQYVFDKDYSVNMGIISEIGRFLCAEWSKENMDLVKAGFYDWYEEMEDMLKDPEKWIITEATELCGVRYDNIEDQVKMASEIIQGEIVVYLGEIS